jgi:transcriptional regulator with XRE-family HTH domain/predicted transcriptional regulator
MMHFVNDLATLGQRMRHFRTGSGLTLDQLGADVGVAASQLSLMENGKREPRLSLLGTIADRLGIPVSDLLEPTAPSERAGLEIELDRAQSSQVYAELGLPVIRAGKGVTDDTLRALVGLHQELARRSREAIATPEEARRANTELRAMMRSRDNHLPEIEALAEDQLRKVGHVAGALTHRSVRQMAEQLGFELVHVHDLPHSARSVTDLQNGRIYLPPASIPGGHGLRSMALQAIAHRLLDHAAPTSYAEFLHQRLEINYFASACLMPLTQSVDFLRQAKADRNIAIEDFRDAFGTTHESAALRFTNLATPYLDMTWHFLRVGDDGAVYKAYENDGLRLPVDVTGSTEGEIVCRRWSARRAFARTNRTTEFYQYTDTPQGSFFESTQIGTSSSDEFSITLGVPFADSKWFRGRETTRREQSRCPDASCCKRPPAELAQHWRSRAWTSAKVHAHIFSPLPSGTFPGVDDRELYEFLETHAAS